MKRKLPFITVMVLIIILLTGCDALMPLSNLYITLCDNISEGSPENTTPYVEKTGVIEIEYPQAKDLVVKIELTPYGDTIGLAEVFERVELTSSYVTIPKEQTSIEFKIRVYKNDENDGSFQILITASAHGFEPAQHYVNILDDDN